MNQIARRLVRLSVHIAAIGVALIGVSHPAVAETAEERLDALDQKIRVLERKLELEREAALAGNKENAVVKAGKDGFILKSADDSFQLRLGGYLQADGRFFFDEKETKPTDTFLIRRAYLTIDGIIAKDFDFRISPDFGQGSSTLQDAWLGYRYSPGLRLRAGRFKAPFGLEYLQSSTDTLFAETALPTNLVPARDLGIQLHGDLFGGVLNYAVGVFNGVQDAGSSNGDANDNKDVVGRVFVRPFKTSETEWLEGLGLGVAVSRGEREGTTSSTGLPSYKTPGQQTFFSYKAGSPASSSNTAVASGRNFRVSPQASYYWGSLGVLGEYVASSQELRIGATRKDVRNEAWQVTASYVLTGEKASYKGVQPKKEWGALEVVARLSELKVDDDAFPSFASITTSARKAKNGGVGFNWYINRNIKLQADIDVTTFDGGATGKDRADEKVFLTRFQVAF